MPADHHRDRPADWFRFDRHRAVLVRRPGGDHDAVGPGAAHHPDRLVQARPAAVEDRVQRVELLPQPPGADPQHQPSAAQPVERGGLLGHDERVLLGQDQDAGRQPDPGGDRRDEGQPHQGFGDGDERPARDRAGFRLRVARFVLDRHDDVLHGPERLISGCLGRPREFHRVLRLGRPGAIGEHDPDSDVHVSSTEQPEMSIFIHLVFDVQWSKTAAKPKPISSNGPVTSCFSFGVSGQVGVTREALCGSAR
jgi:hypothetical protein